MSKRTRHLRLIVFAGLISFMWGGPFYRQVLGGQHPAFRNWVMFKGISVGVAKADFEQRLADGQTKALNRYEVLGLAKNPGRSDIPLSIRRMRWNTGVYQVAQRLCRKLGPKTDLRVRSYWMSRTGWEAGYRGEKNLCEQGPPRKRRISEAKRAQPRQGDER